MALAKPSRRGRLAPATVRRQRPLERASSRAIRASPRYWTATRVDLVYGSNSQLRSIAEEYAANGGEERMFDRFDLHR